MTDVLAFPWVIPAFACVVVLLIVYVPLLKSLPAPIRLRMIVAGFVYVCGAIVLETISGFYFLSQQHLTLWYSIWASLEEIAEMLGVVLFIAALLLHLASRTAGFHVRVVAPAPRSQHTQADALPRQHHV